MFKFLKNLFQKSNEPEVLKNLYKLKNFHENIRNNFRFRYDDYGRFVAIDLVDGLEYSLNILELEYEFGHHEYSKYKYRSGNWDKKLIETIEEIHIEWLNKDREKTIMKSLNELKSIDHFEKLFERKENE